MVAAWHTVLGAVQRLLEQQGLPAPPHAPQAPFEHVPKLPPHVLPEATQVAAVTPLAGATQQPPSEHRLPGQHAWPAPPQAVQVEPPKVPVVHVVVLAVQVLLVQHGSLTPPQLPQAPFEQVPPPTEFGQSTSFAMQAPFTQQPPAVQALPAQHTWPDPPQVEAMVPPVPNAPPVPTLPPVPTVPPVPTMPPVLTEAPAAPPVIGMVAPAPPVPTVKPPVPTVPPVCAAAPPPPPVPDVEPPVFAELPPVLAVPPLLVPPVLLASTPLAPAPPELVRVPPEPPAGNVSPPAPLPPVIGCPPEPLAAVVDPPLPMTTTVVPPETFALGASGFALPPPAPVVALGNPRLSVVHPESAMVIDSAMARTT